MTAQEILFGKGIRKANPPALAEAVGVTKMCIYNWKRNPQKIPLDKLRILIRVQNIPDDQIIRLMRMK